MDIKRRNDWHKIQYYLMAVSPYNITPNRIIISIFVFRISYLKKDNSKNKQ